MAIYFPDGPYLDRNGMGLASATAFSACFWIRPDDPPHVYGSIVSQFAACGVGVFWSSGTTYLNLGDVGTDFNGSALTINSWYHVAWIRNGSSHTVYLNGVSDITATSSYSASRWLLGEYDAGGSGPFSGRLAHLKVWDGIFLTQQEVQQEMRKARPSRFADLFLWSPFIASTAGEDLSGNGRTWTVSGSPTLQDGPPVGWGAAPIIVGAGATAPDYGPYGEPYPHDGVKPWSSMWRAGRF